MLVLGRIVAPFGVQGWVRVHPFADDPAQWAKLPRWWLSRDAEAGPWREVDLTQARVHGESLVALIGGTGDRNGAEQLDGFYIGAPREVMPKPAPDEYYWSDLIGLDVVNEQDCRFGKVAGLIETGANDVLQVSDGDRERLIPFVAAVVKDVDFGAGRIRVAWEADW